MGPEKKARKFIRLTSSAELKIHSMGSEYISRTPVCERARVDSIGKTSGAQPCASSWSTTTCDNQPQATTICALHPTRQLSCLHNGHLVNFDPSSGRGEGNWSCHRLSSNSPLLLQAISQALQYALWAFQREWLPHDIHRKSSITITMRIPISTSRA